MSPKQEYEEYKVKEHDTIATISVIRNVSPETLITVNHLSSSVLHPGQVLMVPKVRKESQSGSSAAGQTEISDAGDIANVATSINFTLQKSFLESYQDIKKAKGEKDIVVSDLKEKLLIESTPSALTLIRSKLKRRISLC